MTALDSFDIEGSERLGESLLDQGLITDDELRIALREQKETGGLLGMILVRLGFLEETELAQELAARTGLEALPDLCPDPALLSHWPRTVAERTRALPLRIEGETLFAALTDPYDLVAQDELRRLFPEPKRLSPAIVEESVVLEEIERLYGPLSAMEDLLGELELEEDDDPTSKSTPPTVRLLDLLLEEAARNGASDIHLEPENTFIRVRYRIDGVLKEVRALHTDHWPALSHRLKILAGMNIADKRSVQDGRFRRSIGGNEIDFRVALMPTSWGETIVVRLLDHKRGLLTLEDLGFDATNRRALETCLQKPEGLTLVTGPTGSGKTTTLYAILAALANAEVNIATLEDPVEYQLPLLRQTAVQEDQGLGFAEGVRAILRMDPDIIFIGEIRDAQTAQNALRAAITGHKVFSTLHCADALGAVPRLLDLGLSPRLLTGALSGLIAQRLVRKLCPACKKQRPATPEECRILGEAPSRAPLLWEAQGCSACGFTGRKGRTAIAEILPLTPELDDLVAADASRLTLLRVAEKAGFRRMRSDGLQRVRAGEISLSDLARVVDLRREA